MRVLFLTHRLPYAPNRGDRVRSFHIVRTLVARGFEVHVLSLAHDGHELEQLARVHELGVEATAVRVPRFRNYASGTLALAGSQPLTHVLLHAPEFDAVVRQIVASREPDVVLAFCSGMARFALAPPLDAYPLVLDFVDVDSRKWSAMAERAAPPKRWIFNREGRYLSQFERTAALRAHANLVVNEREAASLHEIAPEAAIHVVPVGVDLSAFAPPGPPAEAPRVVFCGVMDYAPNVDGMEWFCRSVWPAVRAQRPDAQLTIVGSSPTAAVRRLASADAGIEVTGAVANVQQYLWRSAISVAPLMTARGVQTKVLEAAAAGLPAVVTGPVFEGLPDEVRAACRVADSADSFARHTLDLLAGTPEQRRALANRAAIDRLSWDARLAPLAGILSEAAMSRLVRR